MFRLLSLNKSKGRGREDLLAALGRLRRHLEDKSPISDDLAATLQKKVFNAAPWRDLSRAELETACDTLHRFGQHLACQKAAEAALKQWPREPIFVMYQFQGKYPRGFDYRRRADLGELEDAWQRARDGGDTRTAIRIEKVLPHGPPLRGNFPMPPMFFDDEDEEDEVWPDDAFDPVDPFDAPEVPPPLFDNLDAKELLSSDAVRHMVESIGPVKVMEMLGAPKDVIRDAKQMEKTLGRKALTDMLVNAVQTGIDFRTALGDGPFPGPGDSEPPSTGSSKARSRSKPKTGSGARPKPPSKQATKPRQVRTALEEFRGLFDNLRESQTRLADEQERRCEQTRAADRAGWRDMLLELLELRDRLQAGQEQAARFQPHWYARNRREARLIGSDRKSVV